MSLPQSVTLWALLSCFLDPQYCSHQIHSILLKTFQLLPLLPTRFLSDLFTFFVMSGISWTYKKCWCIHSCSRCLLINLWTFLIRSTGPVNTTKENMTSFIFPQVSSTMEILYHWFKTPIFYHHIKKKSFSFSVFLSSFCYPIIKASGTLFTPILSWILSIRNSHLSGAWGIGSLPMWSTYGKTILD